MPTYVYILTDPRNSSYEPVSGQYVYIGITDNPAVRYAQHICGSGANANKIQWIVGLRSEKLLPAMRILETQDIREKAEERETYWIQHYQARGVLVLNRNKRQYQPNDMFDDPFEKALESWSRGDISDDEFLKQFGNDPLVRVLINWSHSGSSPVLLGGEE